MMARGGEGRFGRYQRIEEVSASSRGAVWRAWDPELARAVAIKWIQPAPDIAPAHVLAEARALAGLSHPSVVAIYDAGIAGGEVYLVMPWLSGTTLRALASSASGPRARRDAIDAYRQVADGLAAAHRAGIVHGNVSPDHAIRSDDGRVHVLAFGLAHGAPRSTSRAGGPYVAPELTAGGAPTAASDQYAVAASLREVLGSEDAPGLPGWLGAAIARATAADPSQRFASIDLLARALARDPARSWRRRALVAAALAVAIAAFAVGRARPATAPTCGGSTAEIAQSWNPARRAAMVAHLRTLGAFGAGEAEQLGDELDRYSAAWADEHHRACVARERGELTAARHERRIACLARGRAALGAIADVMTAVTEDGVAQALVATRSLAAATTCAAGDGPAAAPPAIAAEVAAAAALVERARVLALAAGAGALTEARAAVAAAERTGHAPLIARALIAQGSAALALHVDGEVQAPLERAIDTALRGGDDAQAVEAYARLVYAVGRVRGDTVDNWPAMEALAVRTGVAGRFARALLYNNKAVARMGENDRAGAHALLERAAAAMAEPLAPDELELLSVYSNLALTTDDPEERERRITQAVEQRVAVLGPHDPGTVRTRFLAGALLRNRSAADRALELACAGYRHAHPRRLAEAADCAFERAWIADERGDAPGAVAAMRQAAEDPRSPGERTLGSIAARYVQIATGDDVPGAVRALQELAAQQARESGWWTHTEAADAYATAALGWDRLHRARDAERCWARALELLEGVHQPFYDRRLARARAVLARRWARTRPAEARRLATAAIEWYRGAGGYEAELAQLAPIARPETQARANR